MGMGGQQLTQPLVTHQPDQGYYSEYFNINILLKITGSLLVTFLFDLVVASALTSEFRNRITTTDWVNRSQWFPIGCGGTNYNASQHWQLQAFAVVNALT